MDIVIIGATGLVGFETIKHFIILDDVDSLTTISRRKLPSHLEHQKVKQVVESYLTPEKIVELSIKADVAICALGTTIKDAGSKEQFRYVDFDLVEAFGKFVKNSVVNFWIIILKY